jgi:Tfp pilus assembly protein PilF
VYILALLPVLQIVPLLTLKNDRYLYFPMIGAAGVAAILISALLQGSKQLRSAVVAVSIMVYTALGCTTYYQAQQWKDSITLWHFAIRRDPDNMLAWLMLAKSYTHMGNARDAIASLSTFNQLKLKNGPLRGWEGN